MPKGMLVTNAGPAEIVGSRTDSSQLGGEQQAPASKGAIPANYLTKLLTLFPTEIVGIYTAMVAMWSGSNWWIFTICMIALLLLRYVMTKADGKQLLWQAYIVSIVSFLLWTLIQGDAFLTGSLDTLFETKQDWQKIGSTLAIPWAGIMPAFVSLEAKDE